MEDLYLKGTITKRDVDSVYEALFLRAVTGFEGFLEELFLDILDRRVKYKSVRKVSLKMSAKSREHLIDIVFQGNPYLNWLPFRQTEDRAKRYLLDGKPFTDLDNGDKSKIKTIVTIRNAIAHHSRHSKEEFHDVIDSLHLLKGERTPAGFLRSQVQPTVNRFDVYISDLGRIASILC
jgi:hypothetical protein